MTLFRLATALLVVALTATAANAQGATRSFKSKIPQLDQVQRELQANLTTSTIPEVISEQGETLIRLASLLVQTGLVDALSDPATNYTVFAPTDTAFAAENQEALALYATPQFQQHLSQILLFHVTTGVALSSDLTDGQQIQMVNQEEIQVNVADNGEISLSTEAQGVKARVVQANLLASNGVVHVIDGLLLPSVVFRSILDIGAEYTTLQQLLVSIGVAPDLVLGVVTLFAPTNDAFVALDQETLDFLISPAGESTLTGILLYHVFPSVVTLSALTDGTVLTSSQGSPLTISVTDLVVSVNSATVLQPDILSATAVTHGIDTVLIPPPPPPNAITDIAARTDSLSTLASGLATARLVDTLSNEDDTFTVFAPTNDAFGAIDQDFLQLLLTPAWGRHLIGILLHHVVTPDVLLSTDLSDGLQVDVENGGVLTVSIDEVIALTNAQGLSASVVATDIVATNGVVHLIDTVLLPAFVFRDVIDLSDDYSTLFSLVALTDLEEALREGNRTLFAPTNDAFDAVPALTLEFLSSPAGGESLREVLLYHVLGTVRTLEALVDGTEITTLQETPVSIDVSVEDGVTINGATVVQGNMLAFNGVTHGIDSVLIPFASLPPTIADLGASNPDLSTLVTAVVTADLVDTLADPMAELTVFAPTDEAFAALPEGVLDALLTPAFSQHLTNVLLYHVFNSVILAQDLQDAAEITMVNGELLTVGIDGNVVSLTNGADVATLVLATDILATNGVVHTMAGVLLPAFASRTVVDLGEIYSTVLSLVSLADLEDTLRGGAWTFFAPINDAFDAFSAEQLAVLTNSEGADTLTSILLYHVVPQVLTSDKFGVNATTAATAQGGAVTIENTGEVVTVNGATVVNADILALNGVTHGIASVLIPPVESSAPTSSPVVTSGPGTILELATATESLSILVTALVTSGQDDTLSQMVDPVTVFAPTNDAFDALPAGLLAILLSPTFSDHLNEILNYHVASSALLAADLTNGQDIVMVNGETITVGIDGQGAVSLTNEAGITSLVSTTDIVASNGVVHIVERLLLPSLVYRSIIDLDTASYSSLISLVELADLTDTLRNGLFTIFAPTNDAFAALPQATLDFLTTPDAKATLVDILTYHILDRVLTTSNLRDENIVTTIQGDVLSIGETTVNGIAIVDHDILAINGVTYGLAAVLTPPATLDTGADNNNGSPSAAPPNGDSSSAGALLVGGPSAGVVGCGLAAMLLATMLV